MILTALIAGLTTVLTTADAQQLPEALAVTEADVFAALDLDRPGLADVKDAVAAGDLVAAAGAWADYMRNRDRPTLHFSRDAWADAIRRDYSQLVPPIIEAADRVAHQDLGHGPFHMPAKDGVVDWFSNPTRDTNYVSVVGSQWLLNPLGRAYLLTGDESYANTFVWFFDSWFDHRAEIREKQGGLGFDPMYHAYYPGIRSRILLDNYYCLLTSPALHRGVQMKLMRELLGAARWLHRRHARFHVGNQQVAAVMGPALVGLFLPEFKESDAWIDQAVARMSEHLERDFFPDGGHMEICTQYHKTVLRDVGYVGLTQKRNGLPSLLDGDTGKLLARAYDWLAALVMPTGETPPLHSAVFANDWLIHLTIGARYMKRPDYWWLARRQWNKAVAPNQKSPVSLAIYMLNEDLSRDTIDDALGDWRGQPPSYESIHLDTSGFAIMRTGWGLDDRYLLLQHGWGNTGHAYPGALSFLLAMNREVVATHPGSPRSYALPSYRYCHSTRSHNVVTIDNANHSGESRLAPGGKLHRLADLTGAWYARATHEGYKQKYGAVHERRILAIEKGPIVWLDRITGGEGHTARWHFHTPLQVEVDEARVAHLSGRSTYLLCPANPDGITDVEVEEHWEAVLPRDCQPEDCGKVVPALAYVQPIGPDGVTFAMALIEGSEGKVLALGEAALEIETGEDVYLVRSGPGEMEDVITDAECTCVRVHQGQATEAWIVNGHHLQVAGTDWLRSQEPTDAHLQAP